MRRRTLSSLAAAASAPAGDLLRRRRHDTPGWVHTWTAMPQLTEPGNMPPAPFTADASVLADTRLRQTVHATIGGPRLRVRFSNAFGGGPLPFTAATVARPAGGLAGIPAVEPGTSRPLTFGGRSSAVVPVGAQSSPTRFHWRSARGTT